VHTDNDVWLGQDFCQMASAQPPGIDWHQVYCTICRDGGDLLCCDGCTAAVHPACVGLDAVPEVHAIGRLRRNIWGRVLRVCEVRLDPA